MCICKPSENPQLAEYYYPIHHILLKEFYIPNIPLRFTCYYQRTQRNKLEFMLWKMCMFAEDVIQIKNCNMDCCIADFKFITNFAYPINQCFSDLFKITHITQ